MKRQINRLTLLALLIALASPAAEAAETTATYYTWKLDSVVVTHLNNRTSPQARPGTYNVEIKGERQARLIPVGRTAAQGSNDKWIDLQSVTLPLLRCSAEDLGRRGTFAAGRNRQEVVFSMKGRRGCSFRGTFEVPVDPGPAAASTVPLPNLKIRDARPAPGTTKLKAQIFNQGPGNSVPTKLKLFYHRSGQVLTQSTAVPALAAGQSMWLLIDAPGALANASKVTLRVDDPNVVSESNELDNTFQYK